MTNYGKFTSVWDRMMGTYWDPDRINYGWKDQDVRINKFEKINNLYNKIVGDHSTPEELKGKKKK